MNVGKSIRYALECLDRHEDEPAMMHACAAVHATAKKWATRKTTDRMAFTSFLRDNYDILGPMGARGLNVQGTRFPLAITSSLGEGEQPDLADIILTIHRNAHAHGDEVKVGFELTGRQGLVSTIHIDIENKSIRLPWNLIPGLCAVAVVSDLNTDQYVPDGCHLTYGYPIMRFEINEWWGRKHDFLAQIATQPYPVVKLDFSNVAT
ncbi:hypothetical protein ACQP2U_09620 [Nocardia sp. CA-084685]|uniref:hypothetical protein n=1 Tax=Nocardia sp. CA-084685 TaxID=3239970 RepID=UPI003D9864E7